METYPHTLGKHVQDRADLNTQFSVCNRLPAWEIGQVKAGVKKRECPRSVVLNLLNAVAL